MSSPPQGVPRDVFRTLVESIDDYAVYVLDCAGCVVTWNRGAELNKGYRFEEVAGRHFRMFFVPEDVENGVPEEELRHAMQHGRCTGEAWRLRKGGERFWASYALTVMRDEQNRHIGFAKVTRDLTAWKRQEDALRALEAALRQERDTFLAAAECNPDAFLICDSVRDRDGKIDDFILSFVNKNADRLLETPRADLLGKRMKDRPGVHTVGLFDLYARVVETGEPAQTEVQVGDGNHDGSWLSICAVKLRDGLAITITDITLRKRKEAETLALAQHDPLTGILNRGQLEGCIREAGEHALQSRSMVGVFLLDLDDFKQINDRYGHGVGDLVLREIAYRLNRGLHATSTLIRFGGDEFVIICQGARTLADLHHVGQNILAVVKETIVVSTRLSLTVTASLGLSVIDGILKDAETLIAEADAAMYRAKRRGKNQSGMYVLPAAPSTPILPIQPRPPWKPHQ